MKIVFFLSLMMALSLTQNIAFAQSVASTKVNVENQLPAASSSDVIVINFNASANKERIILNWTLDKNQAVDQIEVEKSKDEKKFVMAGLVFGTDQSDKADYLFYEKNKGTKFFYRLRIVNKDQSVTYSSIVSPEPASTAKL
jgi:hypothetical protein